MTPPRGPVWCAAVAMSAALLSSAVRTQQDQGPPVFRGGTTFVSVDVYPRKDGKFIDNLSAADFTVLEDGKPQKIDTFELIRFEPNEFDSARVDPNSVADAERQAADPHARLFVVYLDVYHTTFNGSRMGSQPVVEFLDRTITRRDLFGVLTPNTPVGALTFARRTETIERALREHWDWGEKRDTGAFLKEPGEQDIEICKARVLDPRKPAPDPVGLHREDLLMTSLERLTSRLGELRDERKNVLFLSEGWVPTGPVTVDAFLPPPQRPPIGVGRGGKLGRDPNPNVLTSAAHVSTDDECRAKLQRLFDMDFGQRFDDLVTAAARANIAFYPVDVGGLKVGGVRSQSTLRTLAEANDGASLVNTNDLRAAFRSLSDRLSAYYLLGYYSNNETRDGKFRKIEVRVANQKVSARLGYFAYPLATRPATVAASSAPVSEALDQLGRLDSDDEVFATAVNRQDGIDVVVELAERPFGAGRWSNGASVAVRLMNGEGAGLRSEARIDPGRRSVLLHVPGGAGSDWRARAEVTGGGVPVETSWVRVASEDGGAVGLPLVYRGTVSARIAVQPAAEMRFGRNERLHLEVPIDDARATERAARILDRKGQSLSVPAAVSVQRAESGRATMSVDVLAGGLASGDYLIEVTGGAGAQVQRRLLAFRVVR